MSQNHSFALKSIAVGYRLRLVTCASVAIGAVKNRTKRSVIKLFMIGHTEFAVYSIVNVYIPWIAVLPEQSEPPEQFQSQCIHTLLHWKVQGPRKLLEPIILADGRPGCGIAYGMASIDVSCMSASHNDITIMTKLGKHWSNFGRL